MFWSCFDALSKCCEEEPLVRVLKSWYDSTFFCILLNANLTEKYLLIESEDKKLILAICHHINYSR